MPAPTRKRILKELSVDMAAHRRRHVREVEAAQSDLVEARRKLDKLWTAYNADAISIEFLREKRYELEDEIRNAEAVLARPETPLEDTKAVVDLALHLIDQAGRYEAAGAADRRKWNWAFFKAIQVQDRQITGVEYEEPFDSLLSKGSISDCLVDLTGIEPGV